MNNPKRGLLIDEAAKAIGVGRTTVFLEISRGHLKARKVGRRTIILDTDLEAYMMSLPEIEVADENLSKDIVG